MRRTKPFAALVVGVSANTHTLKNEYRRLRDNPYLYSTICVPKVNVFFKKLALRNHFFRYFSVVR